MSNTERPPVNWIQIILNIVSIILVILVPFIVWGSSVEKRLTTLETGTARYVKLEVVAEITTDIGWIRRKQEELARTQDLILQALNVYISTGGIK